MYSTHNENKLVITERFINILKTKINETMTVNDRKFSLRYLKILVDWWNNTCHYSINKKNLLMLVNLLTKNIETNSKASKGNVNDWVRITKYKNISIKGCTESWWVKIFIIDSVLKLVLRLIKVKIWVKKSSKKFLRKIVVAE